MLRRSRQGLTQKEDFDGPFALFLVMFQLSLNGQVDPAALGLFGAQAKCRATGHGDSSSLQVTM